MNAKQSPISIQAQTHISFQEDLTREEQEQQFKLRQELRKRREDGEKVCIFRGEIISVDNQSATESTN